MVRDSNYTKLRAKLGDQLNPKASVYADEAYPHDSSHARKAKIATKPTNIARTNTMESIKSTIEMR